MKGKVEDVVLQANVSDALKALERAGGARERAGYRGRDLNVYLNECLIEPTSRRDSSDRNEPGTDSGAATVGFVV